MLPLVLAACGLWGRDVDQVEGAAGRRTTLSAGHVVFQVMFLGRDVTAEAAAQALRDAEFPTPDLVARSIGNPTFLE